VKGNYKCFAQQGYSCGGPTESWAYLNQDPVELIGVSLWASDVHTFFRLIYFSPPKCEEIPKEGFEGGTAHQDPSF